MCFFTRQTACQSVLLEIVLTYYITSLTYSISFKYFYTVASSEEIVFDIVTIPQKFRYPDLIKIIQI